MIQRPLRSLVSSAHAVFAVVIFAVSAACWLPPADAFAQASDAAAAAAPSGQTYAVKPGQSLNDVAGDITGSKDRDVRQKMARQLFEANPNSFAGHDINKLKLGAVLNVPGTEPVAAASEVVASGPAVPQVASAPAQTEAAASAPAPGAAASESAPVASAPAVQEASSVSAQPEPASEPAAAASAPVPVEAAAPARTGPNPALYGGAVTLLVVLALFFKWRSGKRAREVAASRAAVVDPAAPRTFATLEEAQADADARNRALQEQREREARANETALERANKAAPQANVAEAPAPAKPDPVPSAPPQDDAFQPVAPAAHHPAFVPPLPHTQPADAPKPEAPPVHADETAAREALARDLHAREMQLRDAEARQASQEEVHAQLARDAAAREINAHGAELRAAQAEAAEHSDESAADDEYRDDERAPAPRFPMPKFAQEAVQALGSLELGLPPRMELTLNLPGGTVTSHGMQPSEPVRAPIDPAPFTPQPVAEHAGESAVLHAPSVESEIEAGTAGAASVAGLGATQFPPLSMDFNAGLPKSQTEPLPAMTNAQLAAIARNKLELAGEYIELGDLPGARTLLQEVIASNDPATRQRAASLLSTLAPHA